MPLPMSQGRANNDTEATRGEDDTCRGACHGKATQTAAPDYTEAAAPRRILRRDDGPSIAMFDTSGWTHTATEGGRRASWRCACGGSRPGPAALGNRGAVCETPPISCATRVAHRGLNGHRRWEYRSRSPCRGHLVRRRGVRAGACWTMARLARGSLYEMDAADPGTLRARHEGRFVADHLGWRRRARFKVLPERAPIRPLRIDAPVQLGIRRRQKGTRSRGAPGGRRQKNSLFAAAAQCRDGSDSQSIDKHKSPLGSWVGQ